MELTCCHLQCDKPAEFQIFGSQLEDDTLACESHVGELLGSNVDDTLSAWTVTYLGTVNKDTND